MAAVRESGIFNMDGGVWFDLKSGKGIGVTAVVAAARYTNVTAFATIVNNNTLWATTPWGDQNKRLRYAKYGYKIDESVWTQPKVSEEPYEASALAADSFEASSSLNRSSVIRSLDNNKYLYVVPGTEGNSPDTVQFSWVDAHHMATRFTNLLPVLTWLEDSILGDSAAGYEIEQYFFTQRITDTAYNIFSGGPTGPRDIQRAYVPFSKEKGKYLWIDDVDLPPAEMTFDFTNSQYEGTRFVDTIDFQTILDNTFLGQEAYGWSLPQFYFNRAVKPITGNPFEIFWCDEANGPYGCIGDKTPTCDWLCSYAPDFKDFKAFSSWATQYLLDPKCYPDSKAFSIWWGQQDENAFYTWLEELWKRCSGLSAEDCFNVAFWGVDDPSFPTSEGGGCVYFETCDRLQMEVCVAPGEITQSYCIKRGTLDFSQYSGSAIDLGTCLEYTGCINVEFSSPPPPRGGVSKGGVIGYTQCGGKSIRQFIIPGTSVILCIEPDSAWFQGNVDVTILGPC